MYSKSGSNTYVTRGHADVEKDLKLEIGISKSGEI
jgi:hypothetical protein